MYCSAPLGCPTRQPRLLKLHKTNSTPPAPESASIIPRDASASALPATFFKCNCNGQNSSQNACNLFAFIWHELSERFLNRLPNTRRFTQPWSVNLNVYLGETLIYFPHTSSDNLTPAHPGKKTWECEGQSWRWGRKGNVLTGKGLVWNWAELEGGCVWLCYGPYGPYAGTVKQLMVSTRWGFFL